MGSKERIRRKSMIRRTSRGIHSRRPRSYVWTDLDCLLLSQVVVQSSYPGPLSPGPRLLGEGSWSTSYYIFYFLSYACYSFYSLSFSYYSYYSCFYSCFYYFLSSYYSHYSCVYSCSRSYYSFYS